MTDLNTRVEAYLELASKATPPPWKSIAHAHWQGACWISLSGHRGYFIHEKHDSDFIAASHEAAAILREQQARIADLERQFAARGEPVAWRVVYANQATSFITGLPKQSDLDYYRPPNCVGIEYAYLAPPAPAVPPAMTEADLWGGGAMTQPFDSPLRDDDDARRTEKGCLPKRDLSDLFDENGGAFVLGDDDETNDH